MPTYMDLLVLSADAGSWPHMGGWGWGMAIFGLLFMMLMVSLVVLADLAGHSSARVISRRPSWCWRSSR